MLMGSNIYNVHESILLAWLTAHLQKKFPDLSFRVTNFDMDLKNGLALLSTLLNHWPALDKYFQSIVKEPTEEVHYKINSEIIVRMLQVVTNPPAKGCKMHVSLFGMN